MNEKQTRFHAKKDTGCNTKVSTLLSDNPELITEIMLSPTPQIIGCKQQSSMDDFYINLQGRLPRKNFCVSSINGECYEESGLPRQILLDLMEKTSIKAEKKQVQRSAEFHHCRILKSILWLLLLTFVAFAVVFCATTAIQYLLVQLMNLNVLPNELTFNFAYLTSIVAALVCVVFGGIYVSKKSNPTNTQLQRNLMHKLTRGRNQHMRHIIVVKNVCRMSELRQIALYRAISASLNYMPLTFLLILSYNALNTFTEYFENTLEHAAWEHYVPITMRLNEAQGLLQQKATDSKQPLRIGAIAPQAIVGTKTAVLEPTEQGAEQGELLDNAVVSPDVPQAEPQAKTLAAKLKRPETTVTDQIDPPIPGQLDLLEKIAPENTIKQVISFEESTTKDIIRALSDGSLSQFTPAEIVIGALPRIQRMAEKNMNEYLTVLSYTLKKTDLSAIDLSACDNRVWIKMMHWYFANEQTQAIFPLYQNALHAWNCDIILAFYDNLTEAEKTKLTDLLQDYLKNCFEHNRSCSNVIALAKLILQLHENYRTTLITAISSMHSAAQTWQKKENFIIGFCEMIVGITEHFAEKQLISVYHMIETLLSDFSHTNYTNAAMLLISHLKEKFRFHGLSIDSLNDAIFNRDFVTMEHKLLYIDNLLSSPSITDQEKNRYVNYLTLQQQTLSPLHRLTVLQSLVKTGAKIEKSTILDSIKWIQTDSTQEFVDRLVALLCTYQNCGMPKNENIFFFMCTQALSVTERVRILKTYLIGHYTDVSKTIKYLLKQFSDLDETLIALDYAEVVLSALSVFAASSKLSKNDFVDAVGQLFEHTTDCKRFLAILHLLALRYCDLNLNGDQKHELKSAMFRGAAQFSDQDLSVEIGVILKLFHIEYISFVEQKIAKQGDPEVEERILDLINQMNRERQ